MATLAVKLGKPNAPAMLVAEDRRTASVTLERARQASGAIQVRAAAFTTVDLSGLYATVIASTVRPASKILRVIVDVKTVALRPTG
ncbi:MAG: hypothetical protein U0136_22190 [Bdellovibrionota bacterium]